MLKPLKTMLVMVVVMATVLREGVFAQSLKPQEIYQRVLPSVLTLKVLNTQGERFTASAFLALREGVAITSWHSIHDARHVYALLADGTRVEVSGLIDRDEFHDLALIRVNVSNRSLALLSDATPDIGSRLFVIGAPKGFGFSIADGLLSQMPIIDEFTQYQISCPLSTGNSGGPVVDERGEVIGVASWSKLDAQNLNFAVPIEYVRALDPSAATVDWRGANPGLANSNRKKNLRRLSEPDDDLESFRDYLKRAAGQTITLQVQDEEEKRIFRFVVPE